MKVKKIMNGTKNTQNSKSQSRCLEMKPKNVYMTITMKVFKQTDRVDLTVQKDLDLADIKFSVVQ